MSWTISRHYGLEYRRRTISNRLSRFEYWTIKDFYYRPRKWWRSLRWGVLAVGVFYLPIGGWLIWPMVSFQTYPHVPWQAYVGALVILVGHLHLDIEIRRAERRESTPARRAPGGRQ